MFQKLSLQSFIPFLCYNQEKRLQMFPFQFILTIQILG